MVFSDATPEGYDGFYLEMYYPKRFWENMTDDAIEFSERILALKDNSARAVDYFYNQVEPLLASGFTVTVVPSHTANLNPCALLPRCVTLLASRLAVTAGKERVDGTSCLVRHTTVEKLAYGGCRDIEIHTNSIRVENVKHIQGRDVLLLDDVETTGNSCVACMTLLKSAGARSVKSIALAKTAVAIPPELRRVQPPRGS